MVAWVCVVVGGSRLLCKRRSLLLNIIVPPSFVLELCYWKMTVFINETFEFPSPAALMNTIMEIKLNVCIGPQQLPQTTILLSTSRLLHHEQNHHPNL